MIEEKYTGNKLFDINKFENIVLYFAENIKKCWMTKLLKLMWYSEFLHFKKHGRSMRGISFEHRDLSPVPKHFYGLLDLLSEDLNTVYLERIKLNIDCEGEIIKAKKSL